MVNYYPFGLAMKSRSMSEDGYRFGFNGKENDWDFGNSQLIQDYGFRLYNPSIGKFLSVDPLAPNFPWNSSYAFAENDAMRNIDLDGLEKYNVLSKTVTDKLIKLKKAGDFNSMIEMSQNLIHTPTSSYLKRIGLQSEQGTVTKGV